MEKWCSAVFQLFAKNDFQKKTNIDPPNLKFRQLTDFE